MEIIVIIVILGAITVAANYALKEGQRNIHYVVVFAVGLLNAVFILTGLYIASISLFLPDRLDAAFNADLEPVSALVAAGMFAITGLLATLLLVEDVRRWLARWLPKRITPAPGSLTPAQNDFGSLMMTSDGGYIVLPSSTLQMQPPQLPQPTNELLGFDPKNTVHMLALIFGVYLLGNQLGNFVLSGGMSGYAEEIDVTWSTLLLNFIPMLLIPALGTGLLIRRTWSEFLDRVGLGRFTWEAVGVGAGSALALYILVMIMGAIWLSLVSEETLEAQTEASRAFSESITTIWLALGVAATSAVGEEIAFRGALQPILGFWWTAILFALNHIQYTLTPATLIIFVVAIGLGWLRRRYNLYAAITAHFLYNFVPLALGLLSNNS